MAARRRATSAQVDHDAMIAGLEANMIAPVALIQAVIDGMIERRFGRIVNITSGSVKMPIAGLDLSSGARAGLTGFVAGVARSVAHANVTINNLLPGAFDTDRIAALIDGQARAERPRRRRDPRRARAGHSGEAASAIPPSSAPPAPSSARPRPATSPARAC